MPKGFSDKEKQAIHEALLETGKQLFSVHGLKKSGIGEITRAVGISQGSFYSFYGSKEELYLEVLNSEVRFLQEQFLKESFIDPDNSKEGMRRLLRRMIELIVNHPLLKQLLIEKEVDWLRRKLPPEMLESSARRNNAFFLPLIRKWQDAGILSKDRNPEVLSGLILSLSLMTMLRKDIGEAIFDDTIDLWIELFVQGLVIGGSAGNGEPD